MGDTLPALCSSMEHTKYPQPLHSILYHGRKRASLFVVQYLTEKQDGRVRVSICHPKVGCHHPMVFPRSSGLTASSLDATTPGGQNTTVRPYPSLPTEVRG